MEKREGGVMDKCAGVMGYLFGHSFTTAVTKGAVIGAPRLEAGASVLVKCLDAHREQTYHGIYCKRCGKVINA
jgi:hypothetical protein